MDNITDSNDFPDEYVSGEDFRDDRNNLKPQNHSQISWQQKFAVIFLSIFGVSAVVLWSIQFNQGLQVTKPLAGDESASVQTNNSSDLHNMDTDNDGISDYDELNLYNTSPYIEDTDSDGINDKTEIDAGTDPNCPEGQNCFSNETSGADSNTSNNSAANNQDQTNPDNLNTYNSYIEQSQQLDTQSGVDHESIQSILGGEANAQDLRKLLLDSGMNSDTLNNFSDEQLLNIYQSTLQGDNNN